MAFLSSMQQTSATDLLHVIEDGIEKVTLNRPKKRNAITRKMYDDLTRILADSAKNDAVRMFVLTGAGDFYSSGNDMFMKFEEGEDSGESIFMGYKLFIDALILYPKLSVALVNGPAVGIAVTSLALFDMIYASDKATFHTPFSNMGFVAEGCSSYLFPRIMGQSRAGDMLYLGRKMSAIEAKQRGFISEVFQHNKLNDVWPYLKTVSSLSTEAIMETKRLVRRWNQETLLKANEVEMKALVERLNAPDFMERIVKHMRIKNNM